MDEIALLRKLYAEIVLGYSKSIFDGKGCYLRHFSPIEQGEIDAEYFAFYELALREGLQSEKEKLQYLSSVGLWLEKEETDLELKKGELEKLLETKANLAFNSQLQEVNSRIQTLETEISTLKIKKQDLMGLTAEKFCQRKLNEFYIFKSFFKDKNFLEPLFLEGEFEEIDQEVINKLTAAHHLIISSFNEDTFKKIGISNFFQSYFSLAEENIYNFIGKPIAWLTYFQLELISYGRYFKHILSSDNKPPAEIINDPIKLIEWYNSTKNVNKIMDQQKDMGNVAIVGAKPEDLKSLQTETTKVMSLGEVAKSKGKTKLDKSDLMAMMGR